MRLSKKKNKAGVPDYKYTTTFEADVLPCEISESSFISKASLSNLESLIPEGIDFEDNIDLMGVAFNAAVVNRFNKNGDGIDSETAVAYTKNFLHKPTNIEHDKDRIVGHIVNAGWSDYGTSSILSESDVKNYKKPFNIALGALVYKSANSTFAEALERSCSPGPYNQSISTSWEVGFSEFVLAVGSEYLEESTIIDGGDEMQEMLGCLKSYGGSGYTEDGRPVNRLIKGKIYPLGIGYTSNPAADVKGVHMKKQGENPVTINDKRDKNISQSEKTNVNLKKIKNSMETEKVIDELKDLLTEKKFSHEAIASMTSTFTDAIKEKDEEFRAELAKAQEEKEAVAKEQAELKSSVEELKSKFDEAQMKIADYESAQKAEEAIARFNERMDVLDQKFDLEDEDKEFLAKELKSIDEAEEAFASFEDKLTVLWKHKSKEAKAEFEKQIEARIMEEVQKRLSTDSEVEKVVASKTEEEILDSAEATEACIANSNETLSREEKSLKDRFSAAFDRSNIEIS